MLPMQLSCRKLLGNRCRFSTITMFSATAWKADTSK